LPGKRESSAHEIDSGQQQRPKGRGGAGGGLIGVEGETVATGQVTGELEMNPGIVQRHAALAIGEPVCVERKDTQRQTAKQE